LIDNNWSDQYEEALCGESSIFQNENNTHQYDGIENVVCENFKPSAYVVLEKYLKCGKIINETYITGYIDGEDNYNNFFDEYQAVCNVKFPTRHSSKRTSECPSNTTRYGKSNKILWTYTTDLLKIPFTGIPFVVQGHDLKCCHCGNKYYKSYAEKQQTEMDRRNLRQQYTKKRDRISKKKGCQVEMRSREIILFEQFALPGHVSNFTKGIRRLKEKQMALLREDLKEKGGPYHPSYKKRFYLSVPLPEAHSKEAHQNENIVKGHAPCISHPFRLILDRIFSADEFNHAENKLQFVLNVLNNNFPALDRPTDGEIQQLIYIRNLTCHLVEIETEDLKQIAKSNLKENISIGEMSFSTCEYGDISDKTTAANIYMLNSNGDDVIGIDANKNEDSSCHFQTLEFLDAQNIENSLDKTNMDPHLIPVPNLLSCDELDDY